MSGPVAIQAAVDELLAHWVTWSRFQGTAYATIVLKATFALANGRAAEVKPPEPVLWRDKPRQSGALDRADEAAPFLAGAAVIVHGYLYAAGAVPGIPALGRVVVGVDRPVVDKSIAAERNGRIPLLWEEALLTHDNPVGSEEPRLVDPRHPTRTIGLGPIAPGWISRVQLMPAPIQVRDNMFELPDRLDPRYFNAAPIDQQCAPFQGTEAIVLSNLVPGVAELRTWLPAVGVTAVVAIDGAPQRVAFVLDTMTIDAEAGRVSLVWRRAIPVPALAKTLAIQAALGGAFDRTPRADPDAAPPPPAPAPVVIVPPKPAPPPPPAPPRQLERVPDPRRTVAQRAAAGASLEDLDLAGADLHGLDLGGRSLARSNLDRANLRGAKLTGANLAKASLAGAELEGANLDGADLSGANLAKARAAKASFARAKLAGAVLAEAALEQAIFDDADLSDADATKAALTDAKLRRVKANRVKLTQTSLVNAIFDDASLDFAVLERSSLDDASFMGASLADANLSRVAGPGSRFSKARLVRANLANARLGSALVSGADLTSANLEGADLSKARLDGATLDHANAKGAKCVSADLSQASLVETNLQGADLTSARLVQTRRASANLEGAKLKNIIE